MDTEIRIYRKASGAKKPRQMSAKRKGEIVERINALSRVQRNGIVEFFLNGEFHQLPALPTAIIDNRAVRILDHSDAGWTVPIEDCGRKAIRGEAYDQASQAQSILLWIKKNICAYGICDPSEVSVVVE